MGKLPNQAHDGCQRQPANSMAFRAISPCRAQLAPSGAFQVLPPEKNVHPSTK